jgi:hypothetical protein
LARVRFSAIGGSSRVVVGSGDIIVATCHSSWNLAMADGIGGKFAPSDDDDNDETTMTTATIVRWGVEPTASPPSI